MLYNFQQRATFAILHSIVTIICRCTYRFVYLCSVYAVYGTQDTENFTFHMQSKTIYTHVRHTYCLRAGK